MNNKSRLQFTLLIFMGALLVSPTAFAQEAQPGDTCAPSEKHRFQHVGGPENPGTGYKLVCDGAEWKLITEWDTGSGQSLFQVGNDTDPCNSDKSGRLRYTGAASSPWEYCDGSSWVALVPAATGGGGDGGGDVQLTFSFTDRAGLANSTLIYSDTIVPTGFTGSLTVSVSGDGNPQTRVASGAWSATSKPIEAGQQLQVRATSPATGGAQGSVNISIGSASDTWILTTSEKLILYAARNISDGNMGGRFGADNFCLSQIPNGLNCSNHHAFLSVTSTDEIRDMPENYGYSTSSEIYFFNANNQTSGTLAASDWADLTDGTISSSLTGGTGVTGGNNDWWSGSNSRGAITPSTCNGWSVNSGARGQHGRIDEIGPAWISETDGLCSARNVICLCAQ